MCNSVGLELVKGFITLLNLFIILSKILFLAAVNFSVYKVACECLTSSLVQGGNVVFEEVLLTVRSKFIGYYPTFVMLICCTPCTPPSSCFLPRLTKNRNKRAHAKR